jgi:hypothetical protein
MLDTAHLKVFKHHPEGKHAVALDRTVLCKQQEA